ncbi:MAG: hypothetical protein AAFN13_07225 [Bacteroidota bacterium]
MLGRLTSPSALRVVFWLSVSGFIVSLVVHVLALLGRSPAYDFFVLHVGIFVVFFPVLLAINEQAKGVDVDLNTPGGQRDIQKALFRLLSTKEKVAFVCLGLYVTGNFYVGAVSLFKHPDAPVVQLFSGVWLWFYFFCAVFAKRL